MQILMVPLSLTLYKKSRFSLISYRTSDVSELIKTPMTMAARKDGNWKKASQPADLPRLIVWERNANYGCIVICEGTSLLF